MIKLEYSKMLMKEEFKSDILKELDEVIGAKEWIQKHYFLLYCVKGQKSIVKENGHENTMFSIRKPGSSLAHITVDSDFKIIEATYYQDEYNQKVFSVDKLAKMNEIMQGWVGQQIEVEYGDFTARNDDDLILVKKPIKKRNSEDRKNIVKGMLIGKNYEAIREKLKDKNKRIVRMNKSHFVITDDFDPNRINISIDEGIITEISFG